MFAVVPENLRTRAARARVAHGPEIRLGTHARDAGWVYTDLLRPQIKRLVVGLVNGDPQAALRQAQRASEEVPGEVNGVALEVVAEAEVAQHFEKGMVPRGVADVFQVVVLATGANTALARGGAGIATHVLAKEAVLELHHAGVREQQGWVVAGNQRTGRDDRMPLLAEEIEEAGAHFGAAHEGDGRGGAFNGHEAVSAGTGLIHVGGVLGHISVQVQVF